MNRKIPQLVFTIAIIVAILCINKNYKNHKYQSSAQIVMVKESLILMDTLVEITLYGKETSINEALKKVKAEMTRLEQIFNRHDEKAFAGMIESQNVETEPWTVKAPDEYIELLQRACAITKISKGAFNPTIAPVIDLWNFGSSMAPSVPDNVIISEKLKLCSWKLIEVNPPKGTITYLKKDISVDCGGIGKGYIVDKSIKLLKKSGVSAALINGGGDLRTFGNKPDGTGFRIGIQDPDKTGNLAGILKIKDCAVATSGDYERGFTVGSKYYHHLLDPETGYPGRLSRSCTVIATDALAADAFATAIFIKGPEEGIELAESVDSIEAMIITSDKRTVFSSGFEKYLEQ
jgi:thiamine biosynthesis lipoprotein